MTTAAAARKLTVSVEWLEMAAADLEITAENSLTAWIMCGMVHRYAENMGKAAVLRRAVAIKSIADRRSFLRRNGVEA